MEIYNDTYCVYVHINKINGKKYVGKTINGNRPNQRWDNGNGYKNCTYFWRAIQKYGWDNFEHEIIASNLTSYEADNFEILLIEKLKTNNKEYGYNLTLGGKGTAGYHISEESKVKRNQTMSKYFSDPDYIRRMRDVAPKRSVYQFSLDGTLVNSYISAMEAERCTGIRNSAISHCAFGKLSSTHGYIFLFEEDIDKIQHRIERDKNVIKPRKEPIVRLTLDGEYVDPIAYI